MFKVNVRGYRGNTFFSKAIMWITRGNYSHVSLVFRDASSGVMTEIEAIEGFGVIEHLPNTKLTHDFDEFTTDLDLTKAYAAYEAAKELLGGKYDIAGVVGFLIHRKRHSLQKFFCSELVAYVLHKVGNPLSRREPYRETPASVCESFKLSDDF